MRRPTAVIASALTLGALALWAADAPGPAAPSWPTFRGARGDGISSEAIPSPPWPGAAPKILWKARIGNGYSAVSIADGRLYTMGNLRDRDTVWCKDAATGKDLWSISSQSKALGFPGPRATPVISENRVYVVSRHALLQCLDAADGRIVWSLDLVKSLGARLPMHGYAPTPGVFEELLIVPVGASDGAVAAIDKRDGRVVWKSGEGRLGYSSPVFFDEGGRARVAVFMGGGLITLDARTGAPLKRFPFEIRDDHAIVSPVISGERFFIAGGYGAGGALVDMSGEPRAAWRTKEFATHFSTAVLWKGYLYGFDGDSERPPVLRCVDFETGAVKWSKPGPKTGSVLIAAGGNGDSGRNGDRHPDVVKVPVTVSSPATLVILGASGVLTLAEPTPDGYRERSSAKIINGTCWTPPVLCAGRLYLRSQDGDLVCVDVSGK